MESRQRAGRVAAGLCAIAAAMGLAASPYVSSFPLSTSVWAHFVLPLLRGVTLSASRAVSAPDPLAIALPWLGVLLLAWPLLYWTSHGGAADPVRARRRVFLLIGALCGCAIPVSLKAAPGPAAWDGWLYVNASCVALFGALLVTWVLLFPWKGTRLLRVLGIAAGVGLAAYIPMLVGSAILVAWLLILAVSILRGRPTPVADVARTGSRP